MIYVLFRGGIGRVTKGVLLEQFDEVVLVDQSSQYIAAAPAFIGSCDTERVTYLCMVGLLFMQS